MSTAPFGRLLTAMATPFDGSGQVDLHTAKRLAGHLVDTGTEGIVVTGTTGESPTLSDEEKLSLYEAVVESVGSRASVIAGTGSNDTAHSVHLSKMAAGAGVHGLMAVTPYYNRPPQAGLEAHFRAIADATELPMVLYNIPVRTGRLIEVPTICRIAHHERIVGVKDATGDIAHTAAVRAGTPDGFAIYAGDDLSTLSVMAVGGCGVVSVASHVAGRQMRGMIEAFCDGKVDEAASMFVRLAELFRLLSSEPNPIPLKAALRVIEIDCGDPRLPLVPAMASTIEALRSAIAELP
jgi:4-hydroxy-tetrahydrodipicolinate synthase